ncbi:DUF6612 family protein [Halobacillus aidingensis]|uniref:Lipoprotein n=1 Tax=Halobacillus aidingensis TaxID=240303 RepID=A0A1H0VG33_HALAD|nr:DUF6612 family protein [Halobacillus aidingensis]SDP77447.1 hypothetical protein SAMN05421677_13514 [Halobacillus aidingensis]
MAKRTYVAMVSLFLILLLSACGSAEGSKIEKIMSEASEVNKDLQSYAVKTETEQVIKMGKQGNNGLPEGGIPIQSTIDAVHQVEPMAFHQTIESMGQTTEQYYTDKGLYMTNPAGDGWVKAPEKVLEQLQALNVNSQTPAEQMEFLEEYTEDFQLTSEEGHYILTFQSEGENVQKLMEDSLKETLPSGQLPEKLLEGLTVNDLEYTMKIDQDTYYPEMFHLDMNLEIEEDGEQVELKQSIYSEFSRFNEIEEIVVPQNILNQAEEMEDMPGLF